MRFWQSLRYIESEREGEAALLLGLTTRCSGRTRVSRRLLVRRKRRATRRAAERERWTDSDHNFPETGFGRIFLGTK